MLVTLASCVYYLKNSQIEELEKKVKTQKASGLVAVTERLKQESTEDMLKEVCRLAHENENQEGGKEMSLLLLFIKGLIEVFVLLCSDP